MRETLWSAVLALAAACSSSGRGASESCTKTSDCESSLECLDIAQFSGTTCSIVGKVCSVTCTGPSDPACASLGSNFQCVAGCATDPMVCVATSP